MEDKKIVEKTKITEWEKKQKRKKYMREYYLRRKGYKRDGKLKAKKQENTFKIRRGSFIVRFD